MAQLPEAAFAKLLASANDLPPLLLQLDPTFPGPVEPDDFPEVTLGWLRSAAVLQFQATLAVLAHPQCAGEGEILLRPLLDALGHVIFVHQGDGKTTHQSARSRALCLEVGIAKQRTKEIDDRFLAIAEQDRAELSRQCGARLAFVAGPHDATGDACRRPRDYSSVRGTLCELGQNDPNYAMFHDQWIWSSGAGHSYFPSRLYRTRADGLTVVGGSVRAGLRAMLLKIAVDIFVDLGRRALDVHGVHDDQRARLTYWAANYFETPPLRNALRGEFD